MVGVVVVVVVIVVVVVALVIVACEGSNGCLDDGRVVSIYCHLFRY